MTQRAETAAEGAEGVFRAISALEVVATKLESGDAATAEVELTKEHFRITLGLPRGERGERGVGITEITRTMGNGAAGTVDTYTVRLTDGTETTFSVYNGKDGEGAGDMSAAVYDPQGKNTDVFAYIAEAVAGVQIKTDAEPTKDSSNPVASGGVYAALQEGWKPIVRTVTLAADGWEDNVQRVAVEGVSAEEAAQLVTPTPSAASRAAYYDAGICATEQGADTLTFTCEKLPAEDLTVYIAVERAGMELATAIGPQGPAGPAGPPGENGKDGQDGKDGKDGTVAFEDLTEEQRAMLRGEDGKDGEDAPKPVLRTAQLLADGWEDNVQRVTVEGVSAEEAAQLVTPTPSAASRAAYYDAGICATEQGENTLTFTCEKLPAEDLTVYITILEVET